jgi:hypothetical protein
MFLQSFQKWVCWGAKSDFMAQLCWILCHQCQYSHVGTPFLGLSQFKMFFGHAKFLPISGVLAMAI